MSDKLIERWAVVDRRDDDEHVMVYRTQDVAEREAKNLNKLVAQFPNPNGRRYEVVRLCEIEEPVELPADAFPEAVFPNGLTLGPPPLYRVSITTYVTAARDAVERFCDEAMLWLTRRSEDVSVGPLPTVICHTQYDDVSTPPPPMPKVPENIDV